MSRLMLIMVVGLAAFGVAAAVVHYLVEPYNSGFAEHPFVTGIHVVLGALYLTFTPVQLIRRIRARAMSYHRWAGRFLVPIGVLVGLAALFLGLVVPFSGHLERIVIGVFGGLFLISLVLGYVRVRQGRIGEHREWMLRAFAIGLSVATMRALFIPALAIAGNPSNDQIALLSVVSFTVAFLLHAAAAEWWIRRTRPHTRGHADDRSLPNQISSRSGRELARPREAVNRVRHRLERSMTGNLSKALSSPSVERSTSVLLACGLLAGPLFVGLAASQVLLRDGFDLTRHPLSLLSLGELGWIQVTNFVVTGLLSIAFAAGIWRVLHPGRGGTWGPLLVGAFGAGLVLGGVFITDPSLGFPPGAPEGMPDHYSWHATVHNIAPGISLDALILACLVFVRRFAGLRNWRWVTFSAATAVAVLVLSWWPGLDGISIRLATALALALGWMTALAFRLLTEAAQSVDLAAEPTLAV